MSKKPLTAEQRANKNRRQRERYAALIKAGLSPQQARSPKKAVQENPKLFKKIKGIVKGLAESVGLIAPPKKGGKKSTRRDYTDFKKFAAARKGKSANAIIKEYTANGRKITKQRAYEIVREVKGVARDTSKIHTIRYYPNSKYPIYPGEVRKVYMKERYMYLMRYDVERMGWIEPDTLYLTIASRGKLDYDTLINETIIQWEEAQENERKEKYHALRIIPESIVLIRAVDTSK